MLNLVKLFGNSPFTPLQSHMDKVSDCVLKIKELFAALEEKDFEKIEFLAKEISKLEHFADLSKNDLRNNLPKGLFLPINRSEILELLSLQDSLADQAEDISILLTFKQLTLPEEIKEPFHQFLNLNLEAFSDVKAITQELDQLLEFSFGGIEAKKVKALIDEVAVKEHQVDLLQRELIKSLYNMEDQMSYATFNLWQKVIFAVASISNLSEKLANRIRMTLELK